MVGFQLLLDLVLRPDEPYALSVAP
jgi:hypothetical protein